MSLIVKKNKISILFISLILILSFSLNIYGFGGIRGTDSNTMFRYAKDIITTGNITGASKPHLFPLMIIGSIYSYSIINQYSSLIFASTPLGVSELSVHDYFAFFGRLLSTAFGTLCVLLVYLIGKRLYSNNVGLVAALFFAVAPLHVQYSHWAMVEGHLTFWCLLTVFISTFILSSDKKKYYYFATISSALAFTTKYPGVLVIIIPFIAHLLRTKAYKIGHYTVLKAFNNRWILHLILFIVVYFVNLFRDKKLFYSLFLFVFVILLIEPWFLFNPNLYFRGAIEVELVGHMYTPRDWHWEKKDNMIGFFWYIYLFFTRFPIISFLTMIGVFYLIKRHEPRDILLLSWVLAYYFLIGSWGTSYPRYVLPVLPVCLIILSEFLFRSKDFLNKIKLSNARLRLGYLLLILVFVSGFLRPLDMSINMVEQFGLGEVGGYGLTRFEYPNRTIMRWNDLLLSSSSVFLNLINSNFPIRIEGEILGRSLAIFNSFGGRVLNLFPGQELNNSFFVNAGEYNVWVRTMDDCLIRRINLTITQSNNSVSKMLGMHSNNTVDYLRWEYVGLINLTRGNVNIVLQALPENADDALLDLIILTKYNESISSYDEVYNPKNYILSTDPCFNCNVNYTDYCE